MGVVHAARIQRPDLFENLDEIAIPQLPRLGTTIIDGQRIETVLHFMSPAVALCEDVLTADECAALIAYAQDRGLAPSSVIDDETGTPVPHPERTSYGALLGRAETSFIAQIEARLAALTEWPTDNGEGLQILSYRPGQEYRAHYDAFPDGAGGNLHKREAGQRVNTVIVYLQAADAGGGTSFPGSGLTLRPRIGSAVIFRNVDCHGRRDPASLHAGEPVIAGEKIVLTYWQRQHAFT